MRSATIRAGVRRRWPKARRSLRRTAGFGHCEPHFSRCGGMPEWGPESGAADTVNGAGRDAGARRDRMRAILAGYFPDSFHHAALVPPSASGASRRNRRGASLPGYAQRAAGRQGDRQQCRSPEVVLGNAPYRGEARDWREMVESRQRTFHHFHPFADRLIARFVIPHRPGKDRRRCPGCRACRWGRA